MHTKFYAIDRFQEPVSEMLLKLAPSWTVVDSFGVYWTPEFAQGDRGLYALENLGVLDEGYGWMESVLLMDTLTINQTKIHGLMPPNIEGRPDWGQKYDFILSNARALSECAEIVIIPELWGGHGSGSNFIVVCENIDRLIPICDYAVITPIRPTAVLRQWPRKMLECERTGVGLTGKLVSIDAEGWSGNEGAP